MHVSGVVFVSVFASSYSLLVVWNVPDSRPRRYYYILRLVGFLIIVLRSFLRHSINQSINQS